MGLNFGSSVILAGICGLASFVLLVTALATDYWFIIEMNPGNVSDFEDLSSNSGLWRTNEGGKVHAFNADASKYSKTELYMLNLHSAIVVLLPFSLVLLLFGGICGLVSYLAHSPTLLCGTASYFFVCSLLTLCGVNLYILYSHEAVAETERQVGPQGMALIRTSFGWSLLLVWVSYGLELLTGVLLLIASHAVRLQRRSPTVD